MSPQVWAYGLERLALADFTESEAAAWLDILDTAGHVPDRRHATEAREYVYAGFTAETAATWWLARFPANQARRFADAGWNTEQALDLYGILINTRSLARSILPLAFAAPPDEYRSWLVTGLPPERVLRLAAAGVTPEEADRWVDVNDATLDTFAALRG